MRRKGVILYDQKSGSRKKAEGSHVTERKLPECKQLESHAWYIMSLVLCKVKSLGDRKEHRLRFALGLIAGFA